MSPEFSVSAIFPSFDSTPWPPLPSTSSFGLSFAGFFGTTGDSDFLRPIPPRSFASLGGTSRRIARSLPGQCDTQTVRDLGFGIRSPDRLFARRSEDLPGSWGALAYVPRSSTPMPPPLGWLSERRCCLPLDPQRRPASLRIISRLSHAAHTLAVYASQRRLPVRHARLASGWLPALPGGTLTRWAPLEFRCVGDPSAHLLLLQAWPGARGPISSAAQRRAEMGGGTAGSACATGPVPGTPLSRSRSPPRSCPWLRLAPTRENRARQAGHSKASRWLRSALMSGKRRVMSEACMPQQM